MFFRTGTLAWQIKMKGDMKTHCNTVFLSCPLVIGSTENTEILPGVNRDMDIPNIPFKPKKKDRLVVNPYEFFNDPFFNFYIWSPLNLEYLVTSLGKHFPDHLDFISARRARKSRSAVYSPMITASFTQTPFMKLMHRRLSLSLKPCF